MLIINARFLYIKLSFVDATYSFAETQSKDVTTDVLSEILKNIPHKPMKTVTHAYSSGGHNFNQIPIPNVVPPPFKPLKDLPVFNGPSPSFQSQNSENGVPKISSYSPSSFDYSGSSSDTQSIMIDPKAYGAYHSMKMKLSKPKAATQSSLPGPISLSTIQDHNNGFEIQKSIQYEISSS